jgi:hypothetical protein
MRALLNTSFIFTLDNRLTTGQLVGAPVRRLAISATVVYIATAARLQFLEFWMIAGPGTTLDTVLMTAANTVMHCACHFVFL